ncbi:MAG: hypothetical protein HYV07_11720 [Deltaproteobacteria bacterium]|nr:hypothetical protein [Deltaproteobacteria bacterium]
MKRHTQKDTGGFVLLGVLLVLVLLVTSLLVTLRESGQSLREAGQAKYAELMDAAVAHATQRVIDEFQITDVETMASLGTHNIFEVATDTAYRTYTYPPAGTPYAGEFQVQWGFKRGQRSRAPSGEDSAGSFGFVFEVQIQVRSTGASGAERVGLEQRSTIGIRMPGSYGQ